MPAGKSAAILASICFSLKDNNIKLDRSSFMSEQFWVNLSSTIKGLMRHLPNDPDYNKLVGGLDE